MDKTNSSWLKTLSIGFSIISFGITIAIIGYFVLTTKQKQTVNQQQISTSPTTLQPSPTSASNETANWKTYTNRKYGISFKYPFAAKITAQKLALLSFEQSDGVTVEPPYKEPYSKWYTLDLVVRDNPQNLDAKTIIDNFIAEIRKNCSPPACSTPKLILDTLKQYKNGDVDGYIFHIGAETDSVMVIQTKNKKTYIFRMSGDQGYVTNYGVMLFGQILSTFRFTE